MIYTFYSYKGGVGRSMALANVAELFYRAGLKVLMVDWDLEAPGLEKFFPIDREDFYTKLGLMDLLLNYKQQMTNELKLLENGELPFQKPDELIFDIYPDSTSEGKLWLLSAGKRSKDNFTNYANSVRNFDWKDFYETWEGEHYFEWLREQFKKIADVIFIDSRTGVSEMTGVCTYQFADVVVMLSAASDQCLDGTEKMLLEFTRPKVQEIKGQPLDIVVVPTKVEYSESNYLDFFQKEFIEKFVGYIPKKLGSQPDTFWQLCIPYVPKYAYKEGLAIPEKDKEHAKKIVESFSKLASALSILASDESAIRQRMPKTEVNLGQETVSRIQVNSDIFVIQNNTYIEKKSSFSDWGNAPDVNIFFGRLKELRELEKWIIRDRCRMVSILGIGGIGKTDFSLQLARSIEDEFDYVIWRSLRNAPPINEILREIIKYLSDQNLVIQDNLDRQFSQLLNYLRSNRCLLILDNIETILQEKERVGQYRDGYHGYGQLFKLVGESSHQSCLLLTSRETPPEITRLTGDKFSVRYLQLRGLNLSDGQELFNEFGSFSGQDEDWEKLIKSYDGNPLALELAARYIADVFYGNISDFLDKGIPIFDDLKKLLDWHFNRLSEGEKEIMYWLAINREPVSVQDLDEDVVEQKPSSKVPLNIQSLIKRFPLEENQELGFTIQPVIIEYVTEVLIDKICQEIETGKIRVLNNHSLIKATAKDYLRKIQIRLILEPIINKLSTNFRDKKAIESKFSQIIASLREFPSLYSGYVGGNILNLLHQMKIDLSDYDFSGLVISQAYLQDLELHNVNFKNSEFTKSIFTENFSSILSVAFNPKNGNFLATGDADGGIRIWDLENLLQCSYIPAHSSWVRSVAFSPDGKILASGSDDQLVKLWDVSDISTVSLLNELREHTYRVRSVAFSPDGKTLASSSFDKTVKLWNINTGKCAKTFRGHTDWVWTASFSSDGSKLVSSSKDGTVKLWDVKTSEYFELLFNSNQQIQSFAFSFDGQTLAAGSDDNTVKLWQFDKDKDRYIFKNSLSGHSGKVRAVAFNEQNTLASASYDNIVRLWDIKQGECTQTFAGHTHRLRSIAFSPDGKTLVSGGWDQILKLWDISKGDESLRTLQGRTDWIFSADISPDGKLIVSGSDDKEIKFWNVSTGELTRSCEGHENWIWAVAFSPNGKLVASASSDQTVKLWEVSTGKCLQTLTGHKDWVWTTAFSSDGNLLASGSDDQTVKVWDVTTGKVKKTLNSGSGWVRSVAFSPGDKYIASGSDDGKVRLWDVKTGKCINILGKNKGHSDRVRSVAFSPDQNIIASGSYDTTVRIWDVSTGECLKVLTGHTHKVRSVAFSRDGNILASGGNDETIRLWNPITGKCFKVLKGHTDEVRSVAFSRKADILASSSKDGTIRLWDSITGDFIKLLRKPRLYEGMSITGVTGLTDLQKASLKSLGAVED